MRALRITVMGLVALFLGVTQGLTQDGASRSRGMDPNKFFDGITQGKEVWVRSETNPALQPMFDKIAEKLGVTDGKITRDQFVNSVQKKQVDKGGSPAGSSGAMPPGSSPDKPAGNPLSDQNPAGGNGPWQNPGMMLPTQTPPPVEDPRIKVYHYDNLPKELPDWFKQLDTNHDAQIGLYEWKASGRPISEFLRMDRNNDGFLTVEEVLWYQSQMAKNKPDKGQGSPVIRIESTSIPGRPGRTTDMSTSIPDRPGPGPTFDRSKMPRPPKK